MNFRQTILSAITLAMVAALVACSSGSNSGGGGNNPISVSISGAPASLATNATASITATVTNDSANAGVTWSCTPTGACGTFSPTSSASGAATTYTPPATAGSVTITATSVTDTTKSKSATITVTAPAQALADGNYVFQMSGSDISLVGAPPTFNSPYFVAGMFTVSGGAITAGEQDFIDYNVVATDLIDPTASTITTSASGNLQITLTTCTGNTCPGPDTSVGVAGVETINVAMVSATKGRVVEFDTFATSSGTLDLQDTTAISALPSGGYAFAAQGIDVGGNTIAIGGILDMDGNGAITSSSIFDQNRGGNLNPGETFDTTTSVITGPDASGRIVISLKPTNTALPLLKFAGYIVDSTHIRLAEVVDPSSNTMGGTALGQGADVTVSGKSYVVGLTGFNAHGALQQAATLALAQGATGVSGTISYSDLTIVQPAAPLTGGTYAADASGRVTLTGITDGAHTFDLQLYVDGNGNALAISMDTSDITQGLGYQQTAGATISGTYVMDATGADFTNEQEFDDVGLVTTGTGTFASANSGVDSNWLNDGVTPLPASVTVNGVFSSTGTGTGNTITGLDIAAPSSPDAFDYYVADSTKVIAIENDGNQLTLIYFEQ